MAALSGAHVPIFEEGFPGRGSGLSPVVRIAAVIVGYGHGGTTSPCHGEKVRRGNSCGLGFVIFIAVYWELIAKTVLRGNSGFSEEVYP